MCGKNGNIVSTIKIIASIGNLNTCDIDKLIETVQNKKANLITSR